MINFDYEFYEEPFPHIIFPNFISDSKLLNLLSNHKEFEKANIEAPDHYRFSFYTHMYKNKSKIEKKEKKYDFLIPFDKFSEPLNSSIDSILEAMMISHQLKNIFLKHFKQTFIDSGYRDFKDEYILNPEQMWASYEAYNKSKKDKRLLGWHLDNGCKLISGMVYLKSKTDKSSDSSLWLSSGKNKPLKRVPYTNNLALFWPNVPSAWHQTGIRTATNEYRRIINYVIRTGQYWHDHKYGKGKEYGFRKVELI